MKLQSHSQYEDSIDLPNISDKEFRILSRKHRDFKKQPLTLGMFIPCDLEGNVLTEPIKIGYSGSEEILSEFQEQKVIEYQEAKERVLFKGMVIKMSGQEDLIKSIVWNDVLHFYWYSEFNKKWMPSNGLRTIEDLVKYNLELTESAIKKLVL